VNPFDPNPVLLSRFLRACLPALAAFGVPMTTASAAESRIVARGDYVLDFRDPDGAASDVFAERMIEQFFRIYPRLVADFNPEASLRVIFVIQDDDKGVASADNGTVTYHMGWFRKNPADIDVVTHELMHVVQAYQGKAPGWLTEGIADYVRDVYGTANAETGWALRPPVPGSNYTDGYTTTAAFLQWLETAKAPGIVKLLDRQARAGVYGEASWLAAGGAPVEALWEAYQSASAPLPKKTG
jgi:hypothetical protein